MRRRTIALGMAVGLILSMSLAVAPVSAGPPTEIDVSPYERFLVNCGWGIPGSSETAYWTVDLYGGTSGTFNVVVYWGDGSPANTTYHTGSYDTHHLFQCGGGVDYQSWSAWRSGGGTGYDSTRVNTGS